MISISILGYILIPVGIILSFKKDIYLLYATILTCGLTGSSVINLGETAIQPSYYFAILWLIKRMISVLVYKKTIKIDKISKIIITFCIVCSISIIMPFILNGKLTVLTIDDKFETLHFTFSNITQLIYILFCIVYFVNLHNWLKGSDKKKETVKRYFKLSIYITVVITIYQIFAYKVNLPFDVIFKTGVHMEKNTAIFWDTRISGPCLEASMLAYYLIASLPIITEKMKSTLDYILLFVIILLGISSQSSTFLVGFFVWIIYMVISSIKNGKISYKTIVSAIAILILGFVLVLFNTQLFKLTMDMLQAFITKIRLDNISGVDRMSAFNLLLNGFKKSPLMGIGFGSSRGKDLFSTWLANIGILGMGVFIYFVIYGLKKGNCQWRVSVVLVLICMFISVPEPYNLFIWIIMAVAMHKSYKINEE